MGEAGDAAEALRKIKKLSPDIVILDINLPSMDGGELARRLSRLVPKAKLLAFSIHSSPAYVVRMARCGAHGYVVKDQPTGELLAAIKQVHQGGLYFPAGMTDAILSSKQAPSQSQPGRPALTGRELEVLALLTEGRSNRSIAANLGISVRTVETHREHLLQKLNIPTVAGLTKYAIAHGLTAL